MQLSVMNTTVKNNGIGISGGGGIVLGNVPPSGPNAGVIRATLDNVNLTRNNIGLRVSPNTESSVKHSSIDSNISFNLVAFSPGGGVPSLVNADDTAFVESIAGTGVHAEGTGAIIRLSRSIISGNNLGVATLNGGQVLSAGNNFNQGNISGNGAFSGPAPLS